MNEYDVVYLNSDTEIDGIVLLENTRGTILIAYDNPEGYEVEFFDLSGESIGTSAVQRDQISLCTERPVHIIHLRSGFLLSKYNYKSWRDIQGEYEDYITSVGPFNFEGLVEYLTIEYGKDWPISKKEITEFIYSEIQNIKS
jgi:hypothetical protein